MKSALISVAQLLVVGWVIVVAIGLGFLAGRWLDGQLHTSPLFALIGLLLGVVLAFMSVYRMLVSAFTRPGSPRR